MSWDYRIIIFVKRPQQQPGLQRATFTMLEGKQLHVKRAKIKKTAYLDPDVRWRRKIIPQRTVTTN